MEFMNSLNKEEQEKGYGFVLFWLHTIEVLIKNKADIGHQGRTPTRLAKTPGWEMPLAPCLADKELKHLSTHVPIEV